MKFSLSVITFTCLLGMFACKSTKKINTAITKKDTIPVQTVVISDVANEDSLREMRDVIGNIGKHTINFETFSGKAKVEYSDKNGKGPDITMNIRMKKDSIIWVSITATVVNFEAFRMIITPDSVKMLNKQKKELVMKSVDYLQTEANVPFDFATLQQFIIGNPIFFDSAHVVSFQKGGDKFSLMSVTDIFKNMLTVNAADYTLQNSKVDDVNPLNSRTCNIIYGNYDKTNDVWFPKFRDITLADKSRLNVQMDFKQYSFNESLSYPFSIPKNYTAK